MVKIEPHNLNSKEIGEALKQASNASKSLYSNIDITKASSALTGVSEIQSAVSVNNLSNIAINTMRSNLDQISRVNQAINNSAVKMIPELFSTVPSIQSDSFKNLAEVIQKAVSRIDIDYSELTTRLAEVLKNIPKPYTEEEVAEIISDVKNLAEDGWVIYFHLKNIYKRIRLDDISEVESEWISLLEGVLSNNRKIHSLQESECYSSELIKSMVECYLHENYYAAYTLATLAIDGAINRASEFKVSGNWIPVGYKAVKEIEKGILDKTFNDIGLFHWLFKFFERTNRFKLNRPNRHMLGHGRWDAEISKMDFLKIFNVILYIWEEFPYWKELAEENSLETHS